MAANIIAAGSSPQAATPAKSRGQIENPWPSDRENLSYHAGIIRELVKYTLANIIEIGERLTICKKLAGHGNWLPWLQREFGWSEDTAERFMSLHRLQGKIPQIAEYDIPVSGLYLLAAPSTPPAAVNEVIERAAHGETLNHKEIKATVAKHKPAHKPKPTPTPLQRILAKIGTAGGCTQDLINDATVEELQALLDHPGSRPEWRELAHARLEQSTKHRSRAPAPMSAVVVKAAADRAEAPILEREATAEQSAEERKRAYAKQEAQAAPAPPASKASEEPKAPDDQAVQRKARGEAEESILANIRSALTYCGDKNRPLEVVRVIQAAAATLAAHKLTIVKIELKRERAP